MEFAFLSLGSNQGDRLDNLKQALKALSQTEGLRLKKVSSVYQTEPVGVDKQNDFLNAVIEIETDLEPLQLLECLQLIENSLGRKRTVKWGPRIIDIDILYYGEWTFDHPRLKIPHPHIGYRRFVLVPLCEISAGLKSPDGGVPLKQLLSRCLDTSKVELYCQWSEAFEFNNPDCSPSSYSGKKKPGWRRSPRIIGARGGEGKAR